MKNFEERIRLRLTSNANDFDSIVTDLIKGTLTIIEELAKENKLLRDEVKMLNEVQHGQ